MRVTHLVYLAVLAEALLSIVEFRYVLKIYYAIIFVLISVTYGGMAL